MRMLHGLPRTALVALTAIGLTATACAPLPIAAAGPADCREFQAPVSVAGKTTTRYSLQCLQADGTWKVVQTSDTPLPALPTAPYPPALAYDPGFYAGAPAFGYPYGYGYDPFFIGPTIGFGYGFRGGYGGYDRGGFDRGGFDRGGFDRGGFNHGGGGGTWHGGGGGGFHH